MRYFYSTESSSVAGLIAIEEAGLECELTEVSKSRQVNVDLLESVNPMSQVGTAHSVRRTSGPPCPY